MNINEVFADRIYLFLEINKELLNSNNSWHGDLSLQINKLNDYNLKKIKVIDDLNKQYSKKYRTYHNINHILNCLYDFDLIKHKINNPIIFEVAILYHDFIYSRFSKNQQNEQKSAFIINRYLSLTWNDYDIVRDLIYSTNPNIIFDLTSDEKYIKDIDQRILGSDFKTFLNYEYNIRREYWFVPKFIYNKKRLEFLNEVKSRKYIFFTDFFRDKYEAHAKNNIEFLISKLTILR